MSSCPVMRADVDRIAEVRKSLVGARLEFVYYRQTRSSGLAVPPAGDSHEVDLDVVLGLSTGIVSITWERVELVEGLAISFPGPVPDVDEIASVPAGDSAGWRPYIGNEILGVHLGWQVSELDCPESLWALRLDFGTGDGVVVALGELDPDGKPGYHPDSLVVLFGEGMARSYEPRGAIGSSWAEQ